MLAVENLEVVYNDVVLVLRGVSLEVPDGKIVALLGTNGAGKTTTLRAITGLLDIHEGEVTKGEIRFNGAEITEEDPADRVRRGISQVMEGRRVFAEMTVEEIDAAFAKAAAWIAAHAPGKEVYLGGFGCYETAPAESRRAWIAAVRTAAERHGWGWAVWDYRGSFGVRAADGKATAVLEGLFKR